VILVTVYQGDNPDRHFSGGIPKLQKQIIINVTEHEQRIAIIEKGKLVELWYQRPDDVKLVGGIYKGIVTSVFPGMQAAFVEIGEARTAFLHSSDIGRLPEGEGYDADYVDEESITDLVKKQRRANIQDVLHKNQEALVQVIKEPLGTKGARLTTQISLPGRFVVLVPDDHSVRISRRIHNWAEKRRLKKILSALRPEGFGLIARTESEGKSERDFKSDVKKLVKTWKKISKDAEKKEAPALVHQELDITGSLMRDVFSDDVERLIVDDRKVYRSIQSYLKSVDPGLRSKVERYDGDVPIFDLYAVEPELEKLFERKVWLRKGSFLVIDQTEAMFTIDVNTGRYVGKKSQEDTILKANLEAAQEVARQIRLRDMGGLIVVDFIDMMHFDNRRRVYEEFKEAFRLDRAKHSISPISDFGLIEMTRQRIRPSLTQSLSDPCPICNGRGRVLSKDTLGLKLERWFARAKIAAGIKKFRLVVHPTFAEYMTDPKEKRLESLAKSLRLKIDLDTSETLAPDKYQVFSVDDGVELTEMFALRSGKVKI